MTLWFWDTLIHVYDFWKLCFVNTFGFGLVSKMKKIYLDFWNVKASWVVYSSLGGYIIEDLFFGVIMSSSSTS